jgi:hypothetical protein
MVTFPAATVGRKDPAPKAAPGGTELETLKGRGGDTLAFLQQACLESACPTPLQLAHFVPARLWVQRTLGGLPFPGCVVLGAGFTFSGPSFLILKRSPRPVPGISE